MLSVEKFGHNSKGTVAIATLKNAGGICASFISYGAAVQSLCVPDKDGILTDVALGYDTAEAYEKNGDYLGACVGRNANRIGAAAFTLNGRRYRLTANEGKNQLHGGNTGLDKKIWNLRCHGTDSVEFYTFLADGEEGFPGCMAVSVCYTLDDDNGLRIDYRAKSDADTIANFTNHSYFNLNGQGSGSILEHTLRLGAESYTPVDRETLPTGEILPVAGTGMDFRTPKQIGRDRNTPDFAFCKGYDCNFCLDGTGLRKVAEAVGDRSGIIMEVETTMEGIQLYTSQFLSPRKGKGGARYEAYSGFCLETQHYPDAINHSNFPSPILRKGEEYRETTVYRFRTRDTD